MADASKIEWTDASWNPLRARNLATGGIGHWCEHVSEGCRHCYAERMQPRFANPVRYARQDRAKVETFLDEKVLATPLAWRKPRRVFVCSMSDLFGEWVPDEHIDQVFAVMALSPRHTFQVLTKRPERARAYFDTDDLNGRIAYASVDAKLPDELIRRPSLPLPNVWLGVSVEDQPTADQRIPLLLDTPAAIRFVSYEPALGPVDFTRIAFPTGDPRHKLDALTGQALLYGDGIDGNPDVTVRIDKPVKPRLDWIICGGESGPGARPMHPDWARSVRDQCAAAGVAFFMKQIDKKQPIPTDLMVREWPHAAR